MRDGESTREWARNVYLSYGARFFVLTGHPLQSTLIDPAVLWKLFMGFDGSLIRIILHSFNLHFLQ